MSYPITIDHYAFFIFCFPDANHSKAQKRPLTAQQEKIYNLASNGWKAKQIAKRLDMPLAGVYDSMSKMKHNGWDI